MRHLFSIFNLIIIRPNLISTKKNSISKQRYIIDHHKICHTLDGVAVATGQPYIHPLTYLEIVWDALTENDIFRSLIDITKIKKSFYKRVFKLKIAYLELVMPQLNLKKHRDFSLSKFRNTEQHFINNAVGVATGYYKMLGLCYKKSLDKSLLIGDEIKNIIYKNTCYIYNGEYEIPSIIFKMCNGLVRYHVRCEIELKKKILQMLKNNKKLISNAVCYNNISNKAPINIENMRSHSKRSVIDYSNFTSVINDTNKTQGINYTSTSNIHDFVNIDDIQKYPHITTENDISKNTNPNIMENFDHNTTGIVRYEGNSRMFIDAPTTESIDYISTTFLPEFINVTESIINATITNTFKHIPTANLVNFSAITENVYINTIAREIDHTTVTEGIDSNIVTEDVVQINTTKAIDNTINNNNYKNAILEDTRVNNDIEDGFKNLKNYTNNGSTNIGFLKSEYYQSFWDNNFSFIVNTSALMVLIIVIMIIYYFVFRKYFNKKGTRKIYESDSNVLELTEFNSLCTSKDK
ncbi:putative SP-containing membrane protein [Vairimorpha necatrix]|uniref:SP-containing membrane protein n=1 Tax=Vairimorpha necatrix TaxID=6039 RepID=A0AAX4JCN0_9MICR